MIRCFLVWGLIAALIAPSCVAADLPDAPSQVKQNQQDQQILAQAQKYFHTQQAAKVLLKDGSRVAGTITNVTEQELVVRDSKTAQDHTFRLADVQAVKGKGLHPAIKVGIVAGAVFGGLMVLCAIACPD